MDALNRSVAVGDEIRPLWDAALAAEPLGVISFTIPRDDKHNRPERRAIAVLQVAAVQLQSPRHLAPVPACVILLRAPDHVDQVIRSMPIRQSGGCRSPNPGASRSDTGVQRNGCAACRMQLCSHSASPFRLMGYSPA